MLQDFTAGENKEFYTFRQACQVVTQQKTKGKEWWLDCFDQLTDWSLYFDFLYPLCPVSHHQSGLHKNTLLIQSFVPNVLSIYNGVKNAFNFYNTLNDWSQCQKSPFHLSRLFFFFIWVVFKRCIRKPTEFISVGHMGGKPTESLLYYSAVNSGYIEQMPFPRQAVAR